MSVKESVFLSLFITAHFVEAYLPNNIKGALFVF